MIFENKYLFKKTSIASVALMFGAVLFFLATVDKGVAVVSGVMLSSIFVLSSAWILDIFQEAENRMFIQVFFFSTAIRFLLILIIFGILLGTTKINEIYFTVSFIISYLCHSVTEMIFLNKILQKSGSKKP